MVDDRGHSLLAAFNCILAYGPDGALLAGFNTVGGVAYSFAPGPNNTFYVTNSNDQLVRYQVNCQPGPTQKAPPSYLTGRRLVSIRVTALPD